MRDDFHEYSADPSAQKSVTDWLMQVIARKQDAVLHDEASKEKAHPETKSQTSIAVAKPQAAIAVQEAPVSHPAAAVNGSNGASSQNGHAPADASLNGNSYSAPSQNGHGAPLQNGHATPQNGYAAPSQNGHTGSQNGHVASQNGHATSPIIDVFGDIFSEPSQNGNGFATSQNGHSSAPSEEVYEFSADDLCGPPAFGPVPKTVRDEITADDLCWVPKPQVTESYRNGNGNGHHEPVTYPRPEIAAPSPEFLEQMVAEPVVLEPQVVVPEAQAVVPEPEVIESQPVAAVEFVQLPEATVQEQHEPIVATSVAAPSGSAAAVPELTEPAAAAEVAEPLALEPHAVEPQTIMAAEAAEPAIAAEPVVEESATTTPEQWHEQMMAMAKASPEPLVIEAQPNAPAEPAPVAETTTSDQWEPLRAPEITQQPEVIPPEPQLIDAQQGPAVEVVPVAEAVAAPEIVAAPEAAAAEAIAEPQAQTTEQAGGAAPTASEQSTNLVPVERRKRRRPAVSIADICRDWVIEEMEANGGVPARQEYEEEDDFLSEEDSIVQTPESVFAHEGIWGNTAVPGMEDQSALPNIPEIESGAAQAKPKTSSGMKALLRLGTLLPWLAREMEAGNDQNAALTQEVRHEVSGMRLVQYEIRSTVHDHSLQLKRVEEQLTRVREAVSSEQSGTQELVESVKSTTKVVSMVGLGMCLMLVAILGLVMFMVLHGR